MRAIVLAVCVLMGGCTPAQLATAGAVAHTVATTSCGVIAHANRVCVANGLAPSQSCPVPIPVDVTAGGE